MKSRMRMKSCVINDKKRAAQDDNNKHTTKERRFLAAHFCENGKSLPFIIIVQYMSIC